MWPFKPKRKPINPGPINEDWAYGDLAECIGTGGWMNGISGAAEAGPETGDVCKVLDVMPGRTPLGGDLWFLELGGFGRDHYDARCFRKVPPLNATEQTEVAERIKQAARKGSKIGTPA